MTFDADDARAFVQGQVDEHDFLSWLGVVVERVEPGTVALRVPHHDRLTNHGQGHEGQVHGGVAATLIDTAGGVACRTELDDPTGAGVATIDMNVSYLRPAVGDLVATADVIRVGSTVGVAEVAVASGSPASGDAGAETADARRPDARHDRDDLVAVGRGSYRLFGSAEP